MKPTNKRAQPTRISLLNQEAADAAMKSALARQLRRAMKKKKLSKVKMAATMKVSHAYLERILDPEDRNVTITALRKAGRAVGKTLNVWLV